MIKKNAAESLDFAKKIAPTEKKSEKSILGTTEIIKNTDSDASKKPKDIKEVLKLPAG